MTAPWLLLIHSIPPKPDYLRVKIGRRLQRVGAVAIKNSVYVLPANAESLEDLQWIAREIVAGGGEGFVSEASLVGESLTNEMVRARFDLARNEDYRAIIVDARTALNGLRGSRREAQRSDSAGSVVAATRDLAKLRRRHDAVRAIDFFAAEQGTVAASLLSEIEQAIAAHYPDDIRADGPRVHDGATWVTRQDVHVDRIASAWLIRRFIDRRPRFRFVDPKRYIHREGELRFDMFEAEYTHVGDACTFETLVAEFGITDSAVRQIAEVVHDVDCKDGKFQRDEAGGIARLVAGIAATLPKDEDRLDRGARIFDDLHVAFGGYELDSSRKLVMYSNHANRASI